MTQQKAARQKDQLDKNLRYILGIAPDEFGLCPDEQGFVPIKELLGALRSEDGFRSLTENRIREFVDQSLGQASAELADNLIRIKPPLADLPSPKLYEGQKPKLLYIGLKPTAWPVIFKNGLKPKPGQSYSRLFAAQDQALQVAGRFINEPILVAVNKAMAEKGGTKFFIYTERLYLATEIDPAALFGPPVRENPEPSAAKGQTAPKTTEFNRPQIEPIIHHGKKRGKYDNEPDWKNQTRRDRRKDRD
jgi:putative RNA 2'-phosphotransferase